MLTVTQTNAAASALTFESETGQRLPAQLMLPPAAQADTVTDGTSNTLLFGELAPVDFGNPRALQPGFGLQVPAPDAHRFRPGQVLATCRLLPAPGAPQAGGLSVGAARVTQVGISGAAAGVWLQPLGIIAVLIGL